MGKVYVAYGSNLNKQQMRGRCPGSKFLGTGVIEDYELQFKGSLHGAHATIAPKEGSAVPVGLWMIQDRDERSLDRYEGYNAKGYCYYDKEQISVKMDNGCSMEGMVYVMDRMKDFGLPSRGYYQTVRQGYLDCKLDLDVLESALEHSAELAQHRLSQDQTMQW